jgi:hypothetical protein
MLMLVLADNLVPLYTLGSLGDLPGLVVLGYGAVR